MIGRRELMLGAVGLLAADEDVPTFQVWGVIALPVDIRDLGKYGGRLAAFAMKPEWQTPPDGWVMT